MKLSAAIIARNNQGSIGACLESLKGIDEIVILDTGSTDRTTDIASRYPAVKVFYTRWNDDFSEARNKVLDYVKADWVLSIDTDEVLTTGADSVRDVILRNPSAQALMANITSPQIDFRGPRILKREGLIWSRPVHEMPNHRPLSVDTGVTIQHNHNGSSAEHSDRNILILRKILASKHMDTDAMFYLGEELCRREMYDASVFWLAMYVEMSPKHRSYTSWAYYLMACCYWELYRRQKAEDCLMKAVGVNPEFRRAYEMLYEVTKVSKWLEMADKATNADVLVIEKKDGNDNA
jgi:glycosyltransferase involved in cell wall biosynthesis